MPWHVKRVATACWYQPAEHRQRGHFLIRRCLNKCINAGLVHCARTKLHTVLASACRFFVSVFFVFARGALFCCACLSENVCNFRSVNNCSGSGLRCRTHRSRAALAFARLPGPAPATFARPPDDAADAYKMPSAAPLPGVLAPASSKLGVDLPQTSCRTCVLQSGSNRNDQKVGVIANGLPVWNGLHKASCCLDVPEAQPRRSAYGSTAAPLSSTQTAPTSERTPSLLPPAAATCASCAQVGGR